MNPDVLNTNPHHWKRTWLVAILVSFAFVTGIELLLRANGHHRGLATDLDDWASVRETVYDPEGKVIVLLGASRMQLNIDTASLRQRYPDYTVAQLAINGCAPMYALEDLANDPQFKGIVVCSIMMGTLPESGWSGQEKYVAHYHKSNNINSKINRTISLFKKDNLVISDPRIKLFNIVKGFATEKKMMEPFFIHGLSDRSCKADYSKCTEEQLMQFVPEVMRQKNKPQLTLNTNPQKWLKEVQVVETLVQKIHARGGKVIFVRMPTSDELWDYEQQVIPKSLFWDCFVETTSAETIHFKEVATLKSFHCPDRSHLDYRDTEKFTSALFDEISSRNAFGTEAPSIQMATGRKKRTTQ